LFQEFKLAVKSHTSHGIPRDIRQEMVMPFLHHVSPET
jgi:hypothetical protein